MARIRTIKPEFWTDDAVTECSLSARLLFIGIWNFADDAGNLDRSAKQLKARIFPVDDVDCEPLIKELITHRLLIEYSVSGKKYLHIPGFTEHQLINRPSKPVCPMYEPSLSTHAALTMEGKGREGKGIQEARAEVPRETPERPSQVEQVALFAEFITAYPDGLYTEQHRLLAEREYWKLRESGAEHSTLCANARAYAAQIKAKPKTPFNPDKWLRDGYWKGPFDVPKPIQVQQIEARDAASWNRVKQHAAAIGCPLQPYPVDSPDSFETRVKRWENDRPTAQDALRARARGEAA